MELTAICCPNCGANTTNHQNCEYCGSLFVRYRDLGIKFDKQKYEDQIVGLEAALRDNLSAQHSTNGINHITTFISCDNPGFAVQVMNPKAMRDMVYFTLQGSLDTYVLHTRPRISVDSNENSLMVCFRFIEMPKSWTKFDSVANNENETMAKMHSRFKTMDEYQLFKYVEEPLYTAGNIKNCKYHSYYIDFGNDYKGAAAIISQYVMRVLGIYNLKRLQVNYDLVSETDEEYQLKVKKQETSSNNMRMLAILFFGACAVGGYFIGGFWGTIEMIGGIAMVLWAIIGGRK